jgi:hypothetical protein
MGVVPQPVPGNQKRDSRPDGGSHNDVDSAFQQAEHKSGAGGQEHAWQQENHGRRHQANEHDSGPRTLAIDPAQQFNHLLMHTKGV